MWMRLMGAALAIAVLGADASAQRDGGDRVVGPRMAVQRCLARIDQVGARINEHMQRQAQRCARMVSSLVAEGKAEEAAALAGRCSNALNDAARLGAIRVDRVEEQCIVLLQEIGVPDAGIDLVHRAAVAAKTRIETVLHRALQHVADALAGN